MTNDDLLAIHAIEQLKYRYLRHLDLKQFDELATTLTPDATASYGGGAYPFDSRDAIIDFLRRSMSRQAMLTSHKAHHPEIVLTGSDTAEGTWALDDVVVDTDFRVTISGAAYYYDNYRCVDGEWLICHTGYKRIYEQIQPHPADLTLTANWWTTDGRSQIPIED